MDWRHAFPLECGFSWLVIESPELMLGIIRDRLHYPGAPPINECNSFSWLCLVPKLPNDTGVFHLLAQTLASLLSSRSHYLLSFHLSLRCGFIFKVSTQHYPSPNESSLFLSSSLAFWPHLALPGFFLFVPVVHLLCAFHSRSSHLPREEQIQGSEVVRNEGIIRNSYIRLSLECSMTGTRKTYDYGHC